MSYTLKGKSKAVPLHGMKTYVVCRHSSIHSEALH